MNVSSPIQSASRLDPSPGLDILTRIDGVDDPFLTAVSW